MSVFINPTVHHAIPQTSPTINPLFVDLVKISREPNSNFEIIFNTFNELQNGHPYKHNYNFVIEDDMKGGSFHKVVEIKAQQANRFVNEIQACQFIRGSKDGFIRQITINVPGNPVLEERVYIKQINGEIQAIFVQNHDQDFFACLNHVFLDGGKWHWSGSYLYGEEKDIVKMKGMFDSTYNHMLKILDDASQFQEACNSLQKW